MSIFRAYVTYYDELGVDLEARSIIAVETWNDKADTEPQTIAGLTRDATKVGRMCWPKSAYRMAIDIVRHSPDKIVYELKGIKKTGVTRGKA